MNLHLKKSLNYFKNFEWGILWDFVRIVQYDSSVKDLSRLEVIQLYSIRFYLETSWWELEESRELVKTFSDGELEDPVVNFFLTLFYIYMQDKNSFLKLRSLKLSYNQSSWMHNWLRIEFFSRNSQLTEQYKLVNNIINENSGKLPNWVKAVMTRSIVIKEPNVDQLKKFCVKKKLIKSNEQLDKALCSVAGLFSTDELLREDSTDLFPLLKLKKAYLLRSTSMLESLKAFDDFANTKMFTIKSSREWISLAMSLPIDYRGIVQRIEFLKKTGPAYENLEAAYHSDIMILAWITGELDPIIRAANKYTNFTSSLIPQFRYERVFFLYVLRLLNVFINEGHIYNKKPSAEVIYVFGESHSLSLTRLSFNIENNSYSVKNKFLKGIKMYHLSNSNKNYLSKSFLEHLSYIPNKSNLIFTIGEIDSRPNEGIWKNSYHKKIDYHLVVDNTVDGYIEFLFENLSKVEPDLVIIQGIPAPGYELVEDMNPYNEEEFLDMIAYLNSRLKLKSLAAGYIFLDVYAATVNDKGTGNGKWHLDGFHLTPLFYVEEAEKWLIKPEKIS